MSESPIKYSTSAEWTHGHQGVIHSPKKPDVAVVCPPPFCMEADDLWSPEEFFVGAVELCLMMTFLYFADRGRFAFLSYKSRAEGLVEYLDGKAQFTQIHLYPRIAVAEEGLVSKAQRLLRGAERNCLVTLSIKSQVVVHPEIVVGESGSPGPAETKQESSKLEPFE